MADFKKSANLLFLEHYSDLLRQGLTPSEARRQAHEDWVRSLDEFNGFTLDVQSRILYGLVASEGKRLYAESATDNVERLVALKGLGIALQDLFETEVKP